MAKAFFIDTTVCTGCRGCQVACKQWHDLPAEKTSNFGSHQNPKDLSFQTYKLVRMKEQVIENRLQWLFFPDQCRHCIEAPCLETAGAPDAIYKDEATGAVIYTAKTRELDADEIRESCPYNIPRASKSGVIAKCDMCKDRVENGLLPACVKTCPTGAMNFGEREEMTALSQKRMEEVKKKFPKAKLIDPDMVSVIYLTAFDPIMYHEFAVARLSLPEGDSRRVAMRKLAGPVSRFLSAMG